MCTAAAGVRHEFEQYRWNYTTSVLNAATADMASTKKGFIFDTNAILPTTPTKNIRGNDLYGMPV